jgi:hypothetical protein
MTCREKQMRRRRSAAPIAEHAFAAIGKEHDDSQRKADAPQARCAAVIAERAFAAIGKELGESQGKQNAPPEPCAAPTNKIKLSKLLRLHRGAHQAEDS